MSFKSLEQRFNENVDRLYAGATSKFNNGKTSSGPNDDPLVVRKPTDGYWTFAENRSLPIASSLVDVKRLTLFNLSTRGLLFLAKQQLLQTGNTFEFTRALNPAFTLANAVPFIHIKRNLRPLTELAGKTDRSNNNTKTMGQLQFSTYNQLKSRPLQPFTKVEEPVAITASRPNVGKSLAKSLGAPLKALQDTVKGALSAFSPTQKRNVGEIKDNWGEVSWPLSRPELVAYSAGIQEILTKNQERAYNDIKKGMGFDFTPTTEQYVDQNNPSIIETSEKVIKFIKYFDPKQSLSTATAGIQTPNSFKAKRNSNGGYLPERGKIRYIGDQSNYENIDNQASVLEPYKYIQHKFDDPIVVSFAMGKDDHVQFRAYVTNLQQSATPEYKSYQYIGRIEKFINYTGIQRELSFKLGIIAFSEDEINGVWRRINYLTGTVYPYGFNKGILQPNVIRLTLGSVFTDQPGYVSSLTTNFTEIGESWDLTAQVPISAVMDIRFVIIEKATRIASSPFYGITDGDSKGIGGNPMKGFAKTIPIPEKKETPSDPRTDSPKATQQDEETPQFDYPVEYAETPSDFISAPNQMEEEDFDPRTIAERISAGEPLDESGRPILYP